ncbi:hypothetical protein QBC43DRAFT_296696 [Cladorrhinum sp. PSN259]|nr:hypothetical protein QBC43DRAFT_296696 [Cladorrhinum sp. PSN259]
MSPVPISSIPVFTLPASISTPGTPRSTSPVPPNHHHNNINNSFAVGGATGASAGANGDSDGAGRPPFTDPRALLHYVYADLTRLSEVAADHVMLHPADRAITGSGPLVGVEACQQHEEGLAKACANSSGGKLRMRVEDVMVNERFGCVMGFMEVDKGEGREKVEARFCGLWRFEWVDGVVKAAEHWENLDGEGEVRRVMGALRG